MDGERMFEDQERPMPTPEEVESMYLYIDLLRKQLAKAQSQNEKGKSSTGETLSSKDRLLDSERTQFKATVLNLATQNKHLTDQLNKSRRGVSGKEERYLDTRLQVQDLKEALALKELEVQELKAARDFLPTSNVELLTSYQKMRDVFESLRSTLSCSLCYEIFKPNDVVTLECGHTMCITCLRSWSDANTRLYNLTTTPDCPECRLPGKHYVKVYLLEEVVRTVNRLERLEEEGEQEKMAARKLELRLLEMEMKGQSTKHAHANAAGDVDAMEQEAHSIHVAGEEEDEDGQVENLLVERARHRYAGKPGGVQW